MAVWSRFASKNIQKLDLVRKLLFSFKNGAHGKGVNYVPVRNSHETLQIRDSKFDIYKLKDLFYFYIIIGMIPFGLVILYANVFIGPATLAVIPEGYTPKPWEYHRHPITRFFAQYITPSRQELYERSCHVLFEKQEKKMIKQLENRIKDLIEERRDYNSWYFEKPPVKFIRQLRENVIHERQDSAKGPGWIQ